MARRAHGGSVLALVGAQYGSEGKGVIAAHLANEFVVHVRVGGPNAGHSFYHEGQIYKMQSIPCGWTNPNAYLVIGAGALADMKQIQEEVAMIRERTGRDITDRLLIDPAAAILDERHHAEEGGVSGALHARIGSTGHGVGAARHARMARDPGRIKQAKDCAEEFGLLHCIHDTVKFLNGSLLNGSSILLEGTQGSALSLIHGPWPYVTSADTNAAQLAADCGIPPRMVNKTMLVARSHPIRVAGNSGPMTNETTWEAISKKLGKFTSERTTVTHKIRRVSQWDDALFERAVLLNSPTSVAFTFADYVDPANSGKKDYTHLTVETRRFVSRIERMAHCPVALIGTGGEGEWAVVDRGYAL